jgi:hypothetical protein
MVEEALADHPYDLAPTPHACVHQVQHPHVRQSNQWSNILTPMHTINCGFVFLRKYHK